MFRWGMDFEGVGRRLGHVCGAYLCDDVDDFLRLHRVRGHP